MTKINTFGFIAFASCAGIIFWIITGFYGGMLIWFVSYPIVIIALIILYIVSLFNTFISVIQAGYKSNKLKVLPHLAVAVTIIICCLISSDLFKPDKVLSATLHDDLFHYNLILREDGQCETKASGFMGYEETFKGEYIIKGDTIIFTKLPYDNSNFIPGTLLIDKKAQALFMKRHKNGNFKREKEFSSYFAIDTH